MNEVAIQRFAAAEALAEHAARCWLEDLARSESVPYRVALSGGRIARQFFQAIAQQTNARERLVPRTHFFWADERCVPPEDAESNFRMADEALFQPLRVPCEQIHRIRGEWTPAIAAQEAGRELRAQAPQNAQGLPVLDLVFLGMGEDGHIASIFPNAPEEVRQFPESEGSPPSHIYAPVIGPKPPPQRVTLALPVLAAARQAWVLVSGAGKAEILRQSLAGEAQTPLAWLLARRPATTILCVEE